MEETRAEARIERVVGGKRLGFIAAAASVLATTRADQNEAERSVEQQTQLLRGRQDTIWSVITRADLQHLRDMIREDPSVLRARGAVGELPLHMCFIYGTPAHKELAREIVQHAPESICGVYEGSEYAGENCLHIAIVNRDLEMVRFLVEREPALLRGRATGLFFQRGKPCYYGESPLSFAACTNQGEIVRYLLDQGADMTFADTNGNTVLHMMIIHDRTDMYDTLCSEWEARRAPTHAGTDLGWMANADRYTPFTLAAALGKKEFFSHILEKQRIVQWSYGPVTCALYPLDQLDTGFQLAKSAGTRGADELPSAIEVIIEKDQAELLNIPRINELLRKKWARFAEREFLFRGLSTLLYLLVFTTTTVLRPAEGVERSALTPAGFALVLGEIVTVVGGVYKFARELREIRVQGVRAYLGGSGAAFLENFLSSTFCFMLFAAVAFGVVLPHMQDAAWALAGVFGWSYTLFFLLGFRLTGPFVLMLYRMILTDFTRFFLIFAAFLMGFSHAFYVIFNDREGFASFGHRIKACFEAMLGGFEFEDYLTTRYPAVSVTLLVVYVLVVAILLLNMLVAMMGDTYSKIIEDADKQWQLEWARIICSLENEMSEQERSRPSFKYWVELDGKTYIQVQESNERHFDQAAEVAAAAAAPAPAPAPSALDRLLEGQRALAAEVEALRAQLRALQGDGVNVIALS